MLLVRLCHLRARLRSCMPAQSERQRHQQKPTEDGIHRDPPHHREQSQARHDKEDEPEKDGHDPIQHLHHLARQMPADANRRHGLQNAP
jgi:hypothetical protein